MITLNIQSSLFTASVYTGTTEHIKIGARKHRAIALCCTITVALQTQAPCHQNSPKLSLSTSPLSFDAHGPRNPREYPQIPYISRNCIIVVHVCRSYSTGLSSFKFLWWAPYIKRIFSARVRIGRSRSSKVIDLGRVCDFLLVRHSNLGPTVHRFKNIAGFLHTLFHPNFGVFPLDQMAAVGVNPSTYIP